MKSFFGIFITIFAIEGFCAGTTPYSYSIKQKNLKMKDGVEISLSLFMPRPKEDKDDEKFPVLFEMHPYRKDDLFFARDRSLYDYFAKRGFILVKADVRGTGSSGGPVPKLEYSDKELSDAREIIQFLSRMPEGNGNVGMWGISWSGFNAIQTAMQANKPMGLKAILAAHSSDDLYKDDIHYIDGIFHMDEYMLDMNHEVALPKTPDYKIDKTYLKERFNSYPWIFAYMKQQRDGKFWREKSLKFNTSHFNLPVLLIGGLLDSYRDTIPRVLQHASNAQAIMGPYTHSWPDNGTPGPAYEWRADAVKFWNQHLRGIKPEIPNARYKLFIRDTHVPSVSLQTLPGYWCSFENAEDGTVQTRFNLESLSEKKTLPLTYHPGEGAPLGLYWGELTGDMRTISDSGSIVLNFEPADKDVIIAGIPKISFDIETTTPLMNFVARLEDINPDGSIHLVTGAALNGSQRDDRLKPAPFVKGKIATLQFDLHTTTWIFRKGHRIRLVISNAAFPMLWPTPFRAESVFHLKNATLNLPVMNNDLLSQCKPAEKTSVEARPEVADTWENTATPSWPSNIKSFSENGFQIYQADGSSEIKVSDWAIAMNESADYRVNIANPANASYLGKMQHEYFGTDRRFTLKTELSIKSDAKNFDVTVTRTLTQPKAKPLIKKFHEKIKREFQ